MYLARKRIRGVLHYYIRESYPMGDHLHNRDLFHLGTDPGQWVVYPGGNAYHIDQDLEADVRSKSPVGPVYEQLDTILWPFVHPEIKHAVELFRNREREVKRRRRETGRTLHAGFHLFDKRRIHFLRYGQMDQGFIGRVSPKLFRPLHGKSRDEIEQYFLDEERILRPRERKSYVYVAFDLQRFFNQQAAKTMPQALDEAQVDAHFLDEVCRLHGDEAFWAGLDRDGGRLSEYLIRYLVMYFDTDYGESSFMRDYIRDFMNSRRRHMSRPPRPAMSAADAGDLLGVAPEVVKGMSRGEITRIYRKKALKLHPDQGGDHNVFIRLTEAYQALIRGRK